MIKYPWSGLECSKSFPFFMAYDHIHQRLTHTEKHVHTDKESENEREREMYAHIHSRNHTRREK